MTITERRRAARRRRILADWLARRRRDRAVAPVTFDLGMAPVERAG